MLGHATETKDWRKIQQYIEDSIQRGAHWTLDLLLQDPSRPIVQRPLLRPDDRPFEIRSYTQKVAAACQLRGKVANTPCNHCQDSRGPFQQCVYLEGYGNLTKDCCGNCQFDLRTVSSREQTPCSFSRGRRLNLTQLRNFI